MEELLKRPVFAELPIQDVAAAYFIGRMHHLGRDGQGTTRSRQSGIATRRIAAILLRSARWVTCMRSVSASRTEGRSIKPSNWLQLWQYGECVH